VPIGPHLKAELLYLGLSIPPSDRHDTRPLVSCGRGSSRSQFLPHRSLQCLTNPTAIRAAVFGTAAANTTISQRRVIACAHVLPSKIGRLPPHATRHVVGITYARSFRWLTACRTSLRGPLCQFTKRPTECRAASSATSPTPNTMRDTALRQRSANCSPDKTRRRHKGASPPDDVWNISHRGAYASNIN
jgi:hypothetical protein